MLLSNGSTPNPRHGADEAASGAAGHHPEHSRRGPTGQEGEFSRWRIDPTADQDGMIGNPFGTVERSRLCILEIAVKPRTGAIEPGDGAGGDHGFALLNRCGSLSQRCNGSSEILSGWVHPPLREPLR